MCPETFKFAPKQPDLLWTVHINSKYGQLVAQKINLEVIPQRFLDQVQILQRGNKPGRKDQSLGGRTSIRLQNEFQLA